jgi:hypothetical protein
LNATAAAKVYKDERYWLHKDRVASEYCNKNRKKYFKRMAKKKSYA